MGFFDKKRPDDDDDDAAVGSDGIATATKAAPPPPPPASKTTGKAGPPPPPPPDSGFGIDDAVQLMRQLPNRNIDLVMQVVKKTLESMKVDVAKIIDGATKKEHVIEERIG